jgi:hypothetical protein
MKRNNAPTVGVMTGATVFVARIAATDRRQLTPIITSPSVGRRAQRRISSESGDAPGWRDLPVLRIGPDGHRCGGTDRSGCVDRLTQPPVFLP